MPTTKDILTRWIDMDRELSHKLTPAFSGGLNVEDFARKHGVSEQTVRRDIKALKAMGLPIVHMQWKSRHYWIYERECASLFSQNLTPDEHEVLAKEKASTDAEASGDV